MNVEIGTEFEQFSGKEYMNGIFVAVRSTSGEGSKPTSQEKTGTLRSAEIEYKNLSEKVFRTTTWLIQKQVVVPVGHGRTGRGNSKTPTCSRRRQPLYIIVFFYYIIVL
jgi:hypothetical protein